MDIDSEIINKKCRITVIVFLFLYYLIIIQNWIWDNNLVHPSQTIVIIYIYSSIELTPNKKILKLLIKL
jgi:hypothetical protein